ncbi:MAG TPA: AAA family ATPase [Acholeplasmataceae bacterium]|nr:AAA family ATPase [Acholeplasmataceae bacterium]HRX44784.1 AAA family ATPase [Acholeplasmataceae bacterium]
MKLIIIFGPHAVGKMTVGQALSEKTKIPLFHNHESIELALSLLPKDVSFGTLSQEIRAVVFKHVSQAHGLGLIFTFMWALDMKEDHDYMNELETMFIREGADVYFVELCADRDIRLDRNRSENRLKHKPSKRDIEVSTDRFVRMEDTYRLNSYEGEINKPNYIKIDNTNLSPDEVADKILQFFRF